MAFGEWRRQFGLCYPCGMQVRIFASAFMLALLGACVTETRPAPPPQALPVEIKKTWRLFDGTQSIGRLVELELERDGQTLRWWRVETDGGQWVGYATSSGSFYRYLPFEAEETWIGVHPMDEGLGVLFGRKGVRWVDETPDTVEDPWSAFDGPGPVPASFGR